jgi:hypothetical protein
VSLAVISLKVSSRIRNSEVVIMPACLTLGIEFSSMSTVSACICRMFHIDMPLETVINMITAVKQSPARVPIFKPRIVMSYYLLIINSASNGAPFA